VGEGDARQLSVTDGWAGVFLPDLFPPVGTEGTGWCGREGGGEGRGVDGECSRLEGAVFLLVFLLESKINLELIPPLTSLFPITVPTVPTVPTR
jgi:hypothetical protein